MSNTPELRFARDSGDTYPEWREVSIGQLMTIKDVKQLPTASEPLMAFIAYKGVAPKGTKYDRSHLVKSKEKKYKRTDFNDFIYSSNNLDVGSIGLNRYGSAVISVVYEIFKINEDYNPIFISELIQRPKTIDDIIKFRQGCLYGQYKIYPEDFFKVKVKVPVKEEQDKLAELLLNINKEIENQNKKLSYLLDRKEAYLQKIFSRKMRFSSQCKENFDDWDAVMLCDILEERKEKSTGVEEVYSVSVSKGLVNQVEHLGRSFAAENTSKYKLVYPGDVIYTKSPTGDFKWGIVKQSTIDKNVIISPLYGVFIPENKIIGYLIDAYFSSNIRAHNYLITQIRKGAKNTINVSNDEFLNKSIMFPIDKEEQEKISAFVELLNRQILIEQERFELLKKRKLGILQKIFCK